MKSVFGAFTLVLLFALISCGPKITEKKALEIALDTIAKDTLINVDFTQRTQEIQLDGDNWHVSFPFKPELNMRGGEPHVLIDAKTGQIQKVFHTR